MGFNDFNFFFLNDGVRISLRVSPLFYLVLAISHLYRYWLTLTPHYASLEHGENPIFGLSWIVLWNVIT